MKYQLAQHSIKGSRPTNQDRVAYAERENGVLMIVADGLGGYAGGELAAEALTQTAVRAFQAVKQPIITKPSAFLALTIMQAHKAIQTLGNAQIPPITPRTTCVLCLVQNGYAYWAHVGDSRLYHFRDAELLQRTLDHSTTEQLRRDGLLSEEEMQNHPDKGHLLKCLGGPNKPTISLGEETALHRDDMLVLCSDGVWQAFNPEEINHYMGFKSLDEGIEEMLLSAEKKMRKACDNLSAICLRWNEGVPSGLPLQTVPVRETNQQMLWDAATSKAAERKIHKQKKPSNKKDEKKSFEATIKELEDFIKQFEPKP